MILKLIPLPPCPIKVLGADDFEIWGIVEPSEELAWFLRELPKRKVENGLDELEHWEFGAPTVAIARVIDVGDAWQCGRKTPNARRGIET